MEGSVVGSKLNLYPNNPYKGEILLAQADTSDTGLDDLFGDTGSSTSETSAGSAKEAKAGEVAATAKDKKAAGSSSTKDAGLGELFGEEAADKTGTAKEPEEKEKEKKAEKKKKKEKPSKETLDSFWYKVMDPKEMRSTAFPGTTENRFGADTYSNYEDPAKALGDRGRYNMNYDWENFGKWNHVGNNRGFGPFGTPIYSANMLGTKLGYEWFLFGNNGLKFNFDIQPTMYFGSGIVGTKWDMPINFSLDTGKMTFLQTEKTVEKGEGDEKEKITIPGFSMYSRFNLNTAWGIPLHDVGTGRFEITNSTFTLGAGNILGFIDRLDVTLAGNAQFGGDPADRLHTEGYWPGNLFSSVRMGFGRDNGSATLDLEWRHDLSMDIDNWAYGRVNIPGAEQDRYCITATGGRFQYGVQFFRYMHPWNDNSKLNGRMDADFFINYTHPDFIYINEDWNYGLRLSYAEKNTISGSLNGYLGGEKIISVALVGVSWGIPTNVFGVFRFDAPKMGPGIDDDTTKSPDVGNLLRLTNIHINTSGGREPVTKTFKIHTTGHRFFDGEADLVIFNTNENGGNISYNGLYEETRTLSWNGSTNVLSGWTPQAYSGGGNPASISSIKIYDNAHNKIYYVDSAGNLVDPQMVVDPVTGNLKELPVTIDEPLIAKGSGPYRLHLRNFRDKLWKQDKHFWITVEVSVTIDTTSIPAMAVTQYEAGTKNVVWNPEWTHVEASANVDTSGSCDGITSVCWDATDLNAPYNEDTNNIPFGSRRLRSFVNGAVVYKRDGLPQ
ncbi:hypothetical protein ACFLZ2_04760 [Candidatus Margulisiibacteriota bacterium]